MNPVQFKVADKKDLHIKWDDGTASVISLQLLRRFCPCATCESFRAKQTKNYIPLFYNDQITLKKIGEVGSYAVSVVWKDGHGTGIYEFKYLKKLADMQANKQANN